jgi:hypothetical protein
MVESSRGADDDLLLPLAHHPVCAAAGAGHPPGEARSGEALLADPLRRKWHDMVKAGQGCEAFIDWLHRTAGGGDKAEVKNPAMVRNAWASVTRFTDRCNEPGRFTSFIGFEWTSQPGGNDIHRMVIFRDGRAGAGKVLPFSVCDSDDVEDLRTYTERYEQSTGGPLLAISHNGNPFQRADLRPEAPAGWQPDQGLHHLASSRCSPEVAGARLHLTDLVFPLLSRTPL